jgi:hypothetical protein
MDIIKSAFLYNPESPSIKILPFLLPTYSFSNFVQDLHPFCVSLNDPIWPVISSVRSKNCTPKPAEMWKGIWQCINQAPGLSDSNASTR